MKYLNTLLLAVIAVAVSFIAYRVESVVFLEKEKLTAKVEAEMSTVKRELAIARQHQGQQGGRKQRHSSKDTRRQ